MDDAHVLDTVERRVVQKLVDPFYRLVHPASAKVYLGIRLLGSLALEKYAGLGRSLVAAGGAFQLVHRHLGAHRSQQDFNLPFLIRRGDYLNRTRNAPEKHPVSAAHPLLPGSPLHLDGLPAGCPHFAGSLPQLSALLLYDLPGIRLVQHPLGAPQTVQQVTDPVLEVLPGVFDQLGFSGLHVGQLGLDFSLLLAVLGEGFLRLTAKVFDHSPLHL